jgi:uncharacterized damage-inducible protein DinB
MVRCARSVLIIPASAVGAGFPHLRTMTDSLRYPIGRWSRPASLSEAEQQEALRALASQPERLRTALSGLDDNQLDTPYRPGGWSVRQLVHHLADSHLNMYARIRLALTEDTPPIKPYDQDAWAALADVRTLPAEVSVTLLDALHRRLVALLEATSVDDRKRGLMHPENGRMTVEQLMSLYAWHGDHHIAHVSGLRERSGWS